MNKVLTIAITILTVLNVMGQYEIKRDLIYGEDLTYRTSKPYENKFDMDNMIKELVAEAYLGSPDIQNLKLDLYLPENVQVKCPLLILAHDGAFQVGDKGDKFMRYLSENLSSTGIIVASINYGLGFRVSEAKAMEAMHKAAQNMRGAVRFLLNSEYKKIIDEDKIFVAGASAGGITALHAAFKEDSEFDEFYRDKLAGQAFFECMDCGTNHYLSSFTIKGVISMWGGVTDIEFINNNIPTLLIHGEEDMTVPYDYGYPFEQLGIHNKSSGRLIFGKIYGSKSIVKKLGKLGTLITIENSGHSPQYDENSTLNIQTSNMILNSIFTFINQN